MTAVVGYARVSTREQNSQAQEEALRAAGAVRLCVDQGESSRRRDRPQWSACLDFLRAATRWRSGGWTGWRGLRRWRSRRSRICMSVRFKSRA